MLDVVDFIQERGGDLKKLYESQRKRHAPENAIDEVIALYEDHRSSKSICTDSCKILLIVRSKL